MGITDNKKKDVRINKTVRLSSYEKQCLETNARDAGMDESKYIRHLILHGGNVDKNYLYDRQNLIRQISGVATNINQTVHRINSQEHYYYSDGTKLKQELQEIQRLLKEVLNLWR